MPKLLRDVSHARILRFLKSHGWRVERQGAKHTVVSRADDMIAIPRHDVLKTGTVAAILKQAGLKPPYNL